MILIALKAEGRERPTSPRPSDLIYQSQPNLWLMKTGSISTQTLKNGYSNSLTVKSESLPQRNSKNGSTTSNPSIKEAIANLPPDICHRVVSDTSVWVRSGNIKILEAVTRNESGIWGWVSEPHAAPWELYRVHPGGIVIPVRQWIRLDSWICEVLEPTEPIAFQPI